VRIPLLPMLVIAFSMGAAMAQLPEVTPPPTPPGTVEQRSIDETISSKVRDAISSDPELKNLRFTVATADSVVTLEGTAQARDEVARALAIARSVPGVKRVINIIAVQPS
jgi:hyperosmotically inducible periplasmic protein